MNGDGGFRDFSIAVLVIVLVSSVVAMMVWLWE